MIPTLIDLMRKIIFSIFVKDILGIVGSPRLIICD